MFRLRELERKDLKRINEWRNDEELISLLGAPFRYIGPEIDDKWFNDYLLSRNKNVRCAIVQEDDLILGLISLTNINHINQSAELHIMIGDKECRHKGAGTFAVNKIVDYAFSHLNLHRVELSVLQTNAIAIKTYEKCGFKLEGVKKSAIYKNGKFVDELWYAIIRKEL